VNLLVLHELSLGTECFLALLADERPASLTMRLQRCPAREWRLAPLTHRRHGCGRHGFGLGGGECVYFGL